MVLLLFLIASFGATQIALYGRIFDKLRPDTQLFKCSMCMGFWIGILLYWCMAFSGKLITKIMSFDFLIYGFASSGSSYILTTLFNDKGFKITRG